MQYRFSLNFGTLSNFCLNKAENGQFPFELVYPLCYEEYNCTTSQDEYLYIVCPGSSDPFYIVTYNIKLVTTSWTHSNK